MLKGIFVDFYGTLVYEDGEVIKKVSQEIFDTGVVEEKSLIGAYWWKEFQTAFLSSHGDAFKTQRELEYQSLAKTIVHFQISAIWVNRGRREIPQGVTSVENLMEVYQTKYFLHL